MQVRQIKPTSEELRVMLETGFIMREAANFDDAETIFQGCIEFMPDSEVPKIGLGTVYLQKRDFESALKTCKEALEANPNSDYARVHYAEALLFQNQRESALTELRQVISNDPNSAYSRTAQNLLDVAEFMFK